MHYKYIAPSYELSFYMFLYGYIAFVSLAIAGDITVDQTSDMTLPPPEVMYTPFSWGPWLTHFSYVLHNTYIKCFKVTLNTAQVK